MAETNEGRVLVHVTARQTLRYKQTLQLTPAEWEEFKVMSNSEASEFLDGRIYPEDAYDWDDFDIDEAMVVDDDDNPIKPVDAR